MSVRNRVVQGKGQREGAQQRRGKEQRNTVINAVITVQAKSEATLLVPQAACHQHHQGSSKRTYRQTGIRTDQDFFLLPGMDIFLDSG